MSIRLVRAWQVQADQGGYPIIQTAVDDLESFLWILIWVIVEILKGNETAMGHNPAIRLMMRAWSGDLVANMSKGTASALWSDAVFGELIEDWLNIFSRASKKNDSYTRAASATTIGSPEQDEVSEKLQSYSEEIYEKVLKSGFQHLEHVKRYSSWEEVVDANVSQ